MSRTAAGDKGVRGSGWLALGLAALALVVSTTPGNVAAQGDFEPVAEVQVFERVRLVRAVWADGDSFPVRLPDGTEITLRLYEVDCPEDKVGGDSDARRVREQRQYFGLDRNQQVIELGIRATERAQELLREPFTVRTHFADARGDARFKRYYAWVELADGRDLGEVLVIEGLARAHGVYRRRPDGTHQEEARDRMAGIEMVAAVRGRGAWADTDWDRLPEDRQDARRERVEVEELIGGAALQPGEKVNINTAARHELERLPGVGPVLALAIIEARPYEKIEDLTNARGIGARMLENLREWITVDSD